MTKSDELEPQVGIFWLVSGRLILDVSSVSEAEPYGDCLTHRSSHIDYWTEQHSKGVLPRDIEYEEAPRGRVTYNTVQREFYLMAVRCILKDKTMVAKIKNEMHLPVNTIVDTDPHYRCEKCLQGHHPIDDCR